MKFYNVELVLLNNYGMFYKVTAPIVFHMPPEGDYYFIMPIDAQPKPYIIVGISENIVNEVNGRLMPIPLKQTHIFPHLMMFLNPLEQGLLGQFANIDVERIDAQLYRMSDTPIIFDSRNNQFDVE